MEVMRSHMEVTWKPRPHLHLPPPQSYGAEHLLTFSNLRQIGMLVEQPAGETLTVMESRVGKLVNDRTAGDRGGGASLCVGSPSRDTIYSFICMYCFSGKLTDAFSSLAKKSNFRALSRRLALVTRRAHAQMLCSL